MKNRLGKYFWKFWYWFVSLVLFLILEYYIKPQVNRSYFENDVENFTKLYYLKIIIIITTILSISIIIYSLFKRKSFEKITGNILGLILFCFISFFLMQSLFISIILSVNKLDSKKEHKEVYKILSIKDNHNFSAYNIKRDNDFIHDENYLNQKQKENFKNLKVSDTLVFKMNKGLFGVDYIYKN